MAAAEAPTSLLRALPARMRRWLASSAASRDLRSSDTVDFRCNICGSRCRADSKALSREIPSCRGCGSTVRVRTIVHLLTTELFGRSIALPDLPLRKDIVGIGLSDSESYAGPLALKLAYTNSYFHAEPRLDIADVAMKCERKYDFMIASDVFEHVAPPVSRAFANARRLLKDGAFLVFSVPFTLEANTVEHFPELHDYRLAETPQGWVLHNRTVDGREQVYTDLVFHGGPGATLEMRVFSRPALEREFARAGFSRLRVADQAYCEHGIVWPEPWSVPMVAYA